MHYTLGLKVPKIEPCSLGLPSGRFASSFVGAMGSTRWEGCTKYGGSTSQSFNPSWEESAARGIESRLLLPLDTMIKWAETSMVRQIFSEGTTSLVCKFKG